MSCLVVESSESARESGATRSAVKKLFQVSLEVEPGEESVSQSNLEVEAPNSVAFCLTLRAIPLQKRSVDYDSPIWLAGFRTRKAISFQTRSNRLLNNKTTLQHLCCTEN